MHDYPELLDTAGVADLLGVKPATVRTYLMRGSIPEPDYRLSGRPIWLGATMRRWVSERRRWSRTRPGAPIDF